MDEKILNSRYRLHEILGMGGMGTVYRALDEKFNSHVAIKEARYLGSDELVQAFFREAQLLHQMRHPSLVHVIDWFEEDKQQYIVMQYIEGKSFDNILRENSENGQKGFRFDTAIAWINQILDVLEYMHNFKPSVVHQDIKPQNLILTPQNDVVLLDFGLVQVKESSGYESMAGRTPRYAAPEQTLGKVIDTRTDIFLAAMTFYEMLTGLPPISAERRVWELMVNKIDPLEKLHQVDNKISQKVSEVIHSALALEKDDRPASVSAIRNELN